jgi:hypothetical protein
MRRRQPEAAASLAKICRYARAGDHGAVPAGVRPVWWLRDKKMACFAGFSRVPADVAIRGHTLPGVGWFGRQNAKYQDSYFNGLWGP